MSTTLTQPRGHIVILGPVTVGYNITNLRTYQKCVVSEHCHIAIYSSEVTLLWTPVLLLPGTG